MAARKGFKKQPVRYLLFPKGQGGRHRPIPGSGKSHVGRTWERTDVNPSQRWDYRRTLCGLVIRLGSTESRRYDWKRYYAKDVVEWDRVTCDNCLRQKGKGARW